MIFKPEFGDLRTTTGGLCWAGLIITFESGGGGGGDECCL